MLRASIVAYRHYNFNFVSAYESLKGQRQLTPACIHHQIHIHPHNYSSPEVALIHPHLY